MELYIQIIFVLALAKFCLKAAMTGRFCLFRGTRIAGALSDGH